MSETTWQPILTGASAARAREVIAAIAADLAKMSPATEPEAYDRVSPTFSLAAGDAGQALFFAYLDLARPGGGWEEAALARLERAIEATGAIESFPGLYAGFTGVAWVLEHFQGPMFAEGAGAGGGSGEGAETAGAGDAAAEKDLGAGEAAAEYDPGAEIAAALVPYLAQSFTPQDYDLISGLAGMGTYALERLPRRSGTECLEHLAARLEETAEERPEGLAWHTPPALILERDRASYPRGYYNLGVAHGVPGVIGLLAGMCAAGVAAAPARRLLDGAVPWLLAQNQGPDAESCFSYHAGPDSTFVSTRLAWCYGDLGVAATLLASARAVGHAGWEQEALAIGRAAAARAPRPEEIARSADYGLCHGAAGIGHLFNRLYQASGDPCFRAAATIWFEHALAAAQPGTGVGGYLALLSDGDDDQLAWRPDAGFLTGAAGIGLALLAATETAEPAWDRVLLASLPPRRDLPG